MSQLAVGCQLRAVSFSQCMHEEIRSAVVSVFLFPGQVDFFCNIAV